MERTSKNKKILSMLGSGAKKLGKKAADFYKPGIKAIGKGLGKLVSSGGRVGASETARKNWMVRNKVKENWKFKNGGYKMKDK